MDGNKKKKKKNKFYHSPSNGFECSILILMCLKYISQGWGNVFLVCRVYVSFFGIGDDCVAVCRHIMNSRGSLEDWPEG